jgi:phosphohistidine phosphatase
MKQLCLWRHAKSSWDLPVSDRDRPLNERGRNDAPRVAAAMGAFLEPGLAEWRERGLVCASPAERAQATLEAANLEWESLRRIRQLSVESLYSFEWRDLRDYVQSVGQDVSRVLIVGHNPALTELHNWLVQDGAQVLDNLPTAGFVSLSLATDTWAAVGAACAQREVFISPRSLREKTLSD